MEHAKKQIEAKFILESLGHVRQFTGDLAHEGETVVFTMRFPDSDIADHVFLEAVGSCVKAHPHRFDTRKDAMPTEEKAEAKLNRKKVTDKKGERFYEHQDAIIEGWELGTKQPPELVTDEGIAPPRRHHKLKPDVENARAKRLERQKKRKAKKERPTPDWLKELE